MRAGEEGKCGSLISIGALAQGGHADGARAHTRKWLHENTLALPEIQDIRERQRCVAVLFVMRCR